MTKTILTVFLGLATTSLLGQDKKDLTISLGTGLFNSPYFTNAHARVFYSVDVDYSINRRHTLSSSFLSGTHWYYDDILTNNAVPLYENNTNAEADYRIFSLLYKLAPVNNNKFSLHFGAGAGIMTQIVTYPYTDGNVVDFRESTWTDLVFPVKAEGNYKLSKHFQCGIVGGFFIHPDYPFLGYHAGARLSYVIK